MNHEIKVSGEQKVIQVKKAPADKNNKYCVINQEALHKAMKALHRCSAGLPLWMYIAENQNNYIFALSSSHFMNLTGFGKDAYNNAVKALIANGYLVHIEGTKQTYIFFENGTAVKPDIIDKNSPAKENPIDNYREDRQSTVGKPDIELSGEPSINITNITNTTNNTSEEKVEDMKKTMTKEEIEAEFSECPYCIKDGACYFEDSDDVIMVNAEVEPQRADSALLETLVYGEDYIQEGGIITMLSTGKKYFPPIW